jgi:gamma-glutamyl hercynylcysteine S-oxide synthase
MTTIAIPGPVDRQAIAQQLEEARARTLLLLAPLSDADLRLQHDPLMSPLLWDLGHIAHFEELWLTRNLDGPIEFVEMPGLYNPFEHPRKERGSLALPDLSHCVQVMADIRARVLDRLAEADLEGSNPLLRDGYVYRMVLQHEYQHNETMLQTLQLKQGSPYAPPVRHPLPETPVQVRPPAGSMVYFPGGDVEIGTDDRSTSYDNERPGHRVSVAPFWVDVHPVTNGEFADFIAADGYTTRALWSGAGWAWLQESGARAPKYWEWQHGVWFSRSMNRVAPVAADHPVCHVCYYEAEAYARYTGKRLPTEAEWEAAASWDPARGLARSYPWGEDVPTPERANIDQLSFSTAPMGSYGANVSPIGCHGMIGDVWEWTSSDFGPYPGFESFPYPEYSEAFFGNEYKVLRGGSWATRPGAIRNTFRNWDFPIRRQIVSGFRCTRDD